MDADQLTGAVRVRHFARHLEVELTDAARGNALGPALIGPLLAALNQAESDPACHAVLISAAGQHFCRGLDLTNLPSDWNGDQGAMPPWQLFDRLREVPLVTVALVDGEATGGGVALAAACDLVVAGKAASFRFTELLLGLVPAMALPFVADRVGVRQAYKMALTGCRVGSAEAARIGLADLEYPHASQQARALLTMLCRVTPDTMRAMKRLRARLYPRPAWAAQVARQALAERMSDPAVLHRIEGFRTAGALS